MFESEIIMMTIEDNLFLPDKGARQFGVRAVSEGRNSDLFNKFLIPVSMLESEDFFQQCLTRQEALDESGAGVIVFYDETGSYPICSLLDDDEELETHIQLVHAMSHKVVPYDGVYNMLKSRSDRVQSWACGYIYGSESHSFKDKPDLLIGLLLDNSPRVVGMIAEATDSSEVLEVLTGHEDEDIRNAAIDRLQFEFEFLDPEFNPLSTAFRDIPSRKSMRVLHM